MSVLDRVLNRSPRGEADGQRAVSEGSTDEDQNSAGRRNRPPAPDLTYI